MLHNLSKPDTWRELENAERAIREAMYIERDSAIMEKLRKICGDIMAAKFMCH